MEWAAYISPRKRLKVAVYTMLKNEIQHVDDYMASCAEADGVFLVDTGSTDGSDKLLKDKGAVVHHAMISPWRFDVARNVALSLVPADYDICISLDLDQRLAGEWRRELESVWNDGVNRASYWYIAEWTPERQPHVAFVNTLIHSRIGFYWRYPLHEALVPNSIDVAIKMAELRELQVHHFPSPNKVGRDDLGGMRQCVYENPTDARCSFLLARELFSHGMNAEAMAEFQRYLALKANAAHERAFAMRYISDCCGRLGDANAALTWAYRAAGEWPYQRENWLQVVTIASSQDRWAEVYLATKHVLLITARSHDTYNHSYAWNHTPWLWLSVSARHLGNIQEARWACQEGLKITPDDETLRDQLRWLDQHGETA